MRSLLFLTVLSLSASCFMAKDCDIGEGKKYQPLSDLDYIKNEGTWYGLYILPKNFTQSSICWINIYGNSSDDKYTHIVNAYWLKKKSWLTDISTATHQGSNYYTLSYQVLKSFNGDYYTLATDYVHYSVRAACLDSGVRLIWISFRSKDPSETEMAAMEKALKEKGLKLSDFTPLCPDKSLYQ